MKKLIFIIATLISLVSFSQADESTIHVQYGRAAVDIVPEIFIDFHPYHQDIEGGGSRFGNLTRVTTPIDTIFLFPPGLDPKYPDLEFKWWLNDTLTYTGGNPRVRDFKRKYSGIMWLHVYVRHKTTGVTFNRGKWVYIQFDEYNDNPNKGLIPDEFVYVPLGETRPSGQFGVFVPWYPVDFIPFDHVQMDHDYDHNGIVTATDLSVFLTRYSY